MSRMSCGNPVPGRTRHLYGRIVSFFANLSVQVKIGIIVLVSVVVALVIGILGLHALNGAATAAHNIYAGNLSSTNALGLVSTAMAQSRLSLANQILSGDAATTAKYTEAFKSD